MRTNRRAPESGRKLKRKRYRTRLITGSAIALACVAAMGSFLYIRSKRLEVAFYENAQVNLNETADTYQFIKTLRNGKILTEKTEIDTSKTGEQTIYLTVKPLFGEKRVFRYTVSVVDRESPRIFYTNFLETVEGEKIDLLQGVSATDNSGEEIAVTVEGNYDFSTPGEYELQYVARDSGGNRTEERFTLRVKKKVARADSVPPSAAKDPPVTFVTSKGYRGVIRDGVTYIDGYLIANKTYGLPSGYGSGLTGETKSAFQAMSAAARAEGLNIYISSGFRSYSVQKNLYNTYVRRDGTEKADTYSARAGHSEHQTGLAVDVNIVSDAFIGTPEAVWLADRCYQYGFILRYPDGKTDETGYKYEPWHFRYVGVDLATKLYNGGNWITMEDYFGITSKYE